MPYRDDYASSNDYSDSSDDYCDNGPDPLTYDVWADENYDAIVELYTKFKELGEHLFGSAFLQHCDHVMFIKFVHKHTVQLN